MCRIKRLGVAAKVPEYPVNDRRRLPKPRRGRLRLLLPGYVGFAEFFQDLIRIDHEFANIVAVDLL